MTEASLPVHARELSIITLCDMTPLLIGPVRSLNRVDESWDWPCSEEIRRKMKPLTSTLPGFMGNAWCTDTRTLQLWPLCFLGEGDCRYIGRFEPREAKGYPGSQIWSC